MTGERTVERVIAHLRAQVSELRRLEREGARDEELQERRRVVLRLQDQLAGLVLGVLEGTRLPQPR